MAHQSQILLCRCGRASLVPSADYVQSRRRQTIPFTFAACRQRRHRQISAAAAGGDAENDDEFDARLAKLRKDKSVPGGRGKSRETPYSVLQEQKKADKSGKIKDWGEEKVFLETAPHRGDLAVNIAFGFTLLWLPLTVAAIGRAAFVKYKFTDKRISVATSAPWKNEELNASYGRVDSVVSIGRGVGAWGDMVVNLKDGSKIEMRALPRHKDVEKYINEQCKAAKANPAGKATAKSTSSTRTSK